MILGRVEAMGFKGEKGMQHKAGAYGKPEVSVDNGKKDATNQKRFW